MVKARERYDTFMELQSLEECCGSRCVSVGSEHDALEPRRLPEASVEGIVVLPGHCLLWDPEIIILGHLRKRGGQERHDEIILYKGST